MKFIRVDEMDLAIVNAWILTLAKNRLGIIKNGTIGIEGDRIGFIGSTDDIDTKKIDVIIDGKNHLVMPGLVNSHIHTSLTLLRGGAQDLPEIEWMNKGIGPLAKHLDSKDLILGSKLGVLEAIKTGTTTFSEYTRDVARLVEQVYLPIGARVVATETINEVAQVNKAALKPSDLYEFDNKKGQQALTKNDQLFEKYKNKPLVSCMYGPQALDMVSLDTLKTIKENAISRNSKIHMHVAQGKRERLQITGRFGKDASTVKVLDNHELLDNYLVAVHCHDTEEQERELMVSKNVKMVGCPSSISIIDGIIPPIYHYFSLGGKVGIGTDQAPGPGNHNLFREMRTISLLTKTQFRDPTAFPSWQMLFLITIFGAEILGLEKEIGTLEIGKRADVISFDMNNLLLTPMVSNPFHNFIPNLVHSATGTEVDNVIIDGKLIIHQRKFTSINEQKIIDEANKRAEKIFADASDDWKAAGSQMVKDVEKGLI
ncbi:MAG: amidohydrolase family protein [Asgard group archaeon]|nr:amidohydrolase family protein [Asgard group archaeon]